MNFHLDLLLNLGLIHERIAMKNNISSAANCLTVDTVWFDLM